MGKFHIHRNRRACRSSDVEISKEEAILVIKSDPEHASKTEEHIHHWLVVGVQFKVGKQWIGYIADAGE